MEYRITHATHMSSFLIAGETLKAPEGRQGGRQVAVLKDGRVMAPAFQAGEVFCHDVTTTSVRLTWPKFSDKKYPVYAYRVCKAEVGNGFEVCTSSPCTTSSMLVIFVRLNIMFCVLLSRTKPQGGTVALKNQERGIPKRDVERRTDR